MKLDVWHNIMWSRYRAAVFSAMFKQSTVLGIDVRFFQIAETTDDRIALSAIDHSLHEYPYKNLFQGSYSQIPPLQLFYEIAKISLTTRADLSIISGYDRLEHWLQAAILLVRRRRYAVFCDSTINDRPQLFWKGVAKRVFFFFCAGAFCYGERSGAYVEYYGVKKENIRVGCQATWLPKEYNATNIKTRRLRARKKTENFRYLYVGRLSKEKGVDTLVQAFQRVTFTYPTAKLAVVGAGPEAASLQQLARDLRIEAKVEFMGSKSGEALWSEYLRASCLVLPSRSEAWGLVANEALSYGCPIIVSDRCGCVPELVREGRTGWTFCCDDVEELRDRLLSSGEDFPDQPDVVDACLAVVAPFTPDNAALIILQGARDFAQISPSGLREDRAKRTLARRRLT
jgi:glycosyltransferase involved in cell wall biosynthesis